MRVSLFIICAFVFSTIASAPAHASLPEEEPSAVSSSMAKAEVLDVFSAKEGELKFRAYVVEWTGQKVVVTDSLGTTTHKKGDTISFMIQRVQFPDKGISALGFVTLEAMR